MGRCSRVVQSGEEKALRKPYSSFQYIKGPKRKAGEGLFAREYTNRTKGNGLKVKEGTIRLDVIKKFFTVGVLRRGNVSGEVVDVPSLEEFKTK